MRSRTRTSTGLGGTSASYGCLCRHADRGEDASCFESISCVCVGVRDEGPTAASLNMQSFLGIPDWQGPSSSLKSATYFFAVVGIPGDVWASTEGLPRQSFGVHVSVPTWTKKGLSKSIKQLLSGVARNARG